MDSYSLKRVSRSRTVRVRIDPGGAVVVTAPKYTPKFIIDKFVKANEDWIQRHVAKTKLVKTAFPVFEWEQRVVSYLGRLFQIKITDDRLRMTVKDYVMTISPVTGLESDAKKMLVSWLKREGEREITERVKIWAPKMETNFTGIKFRQQKSRWGSCTRDNRLSFNWRLVHFKPEIIDYVVVHELAHTIHHDHSKAFWEKVAEFSPGYKQQIKILHRQILELI